jgi:nucleotide-binding universal stress UspA family protein
MAGTGLPKTPYLALDELATDPTLARRLPVAMARRFHALPLAEERGRVTVAMANPGDAAARETIERVLGPALYLVQANAATIDTLISEIWGDEASPPLQFVLGNTPSPASAAVQDYARTLAGSLGAKLSDAKLKFTGDVAGNGGRCDGDLVIVEEMDHPLIRSLFPAPTGAKPEQATPIDPLSMPSALLAVRQPRWPLERLLLILCSDEKAYGAAGWVLRLARLCRSTVTVLVVVPGVPTPDDRRTRPHQGVSGLLSGDTSLGRQVRTVTRHLVNSGIEGTLRLRQGASDEQLEREATEGDYDLVAVAASCRPVGRSWPDEDVIRTVLHCTDRPVLIVSSTAAR